MDIWVLDKSRAVHKAQSNGSLSQVVVIFFLNAFVFRSLVTSVHGCQQEAIGLGTHGRVKVWRAPYLALPGPPPQVWISTRLKL